MARAQNSNKGRHAKQTYDVAASGSIIFEDYSASTALLSANSTALKVAGGVQVSGQSASVITGNTTGIVLAGGVKVSNKQAITANSTGFIFASRATKPAARSASKWAFITNSTGVNSLAVNTTGTTWKYVTMTSTLNSAAGYP